MRPGSLLLCVVWTMCLLAVPLTPVRAAGPQLLVLNKGNLTMVTVDPATLKVTGSYPSGPDPHEVIASSDGTLAYISNYSSGSTISMIDLVAKKPLPPIPLGDLSRPHGLDFAGGKLYFTAEGTNVVARYDPATRRIDWVVPTGQYGTHMVVVSSDLKRVTTTNLASGSASFIELLMPAANPRTAPPADWRVASVATGNGAEANDISPDGKEMWVGNAGDRTVSIIDMRTKKTVQTVKVSINRVNRLKFTRDGRHVLMSDLSGSDLFVLDAAGRTEVRRINLGAGASGVAGILMEPGGERAFVSVGSRNFVAVIDTKTLTMTGRIESGPRPDGLAWAMSN